MKPAYVITRSTNPYHANIYLKNRDGLLSSTEQIVGFADIFSEANSKLSDIIEPLSDNYISDNGSIFESGEVVFDQTTKSFNHDIWFYSILTWSEFFEKYRWSGVKTLLEL